MKIYSKIQNLDKNNFIRMNNLKSLQKIQNMNKEYNKPFKPESALTHFLTDRIPTLKSDLKYAGPLPYRYILKSDGKEMKHTDFMLIAKNQWE